MSRLTYKSFCGDYGSAVDFKSDIEEITALRNKLGVYEDAFEWYDIKDMPTEKGLYDFTIRVHDSFIVLLGIYFNGVDLPPDVVAWRKYASHILEEPCEG